MERIKCKTCGCESMMPMNVILEDHEDKIDLLDGEQESRFFSCHLCGDNWLSVKETELDGDCRITFVHQMGMSPILKRVAKMQTPALIDESTVEEWTYYFDDSPVEEETWRNKLKDRRDTLRSICMN